MAGYIGSLELIRSFSNKDGEYRFLGVFDDSHIFVRKTCANEKYSYLKIDITQDAKTKIKDCSETFLSESRIKIEECLRISGNFLCIIVGPSSGSSSKSSVARDVRLLNENDGLFYDIKQELAVDNPVAIAIYDEHIYYLDGHKMIQKVAVKTDIKEEIDLMEIQPLYKAFDLIPINDGQVILKCNGDTLALVSKKCESKPKNKKYSIRPVTQEVLVKKCLQGPNGHAYVLYVPKVVKSSVYIAPWAEKLTTKHAKCLLKNKHQITTVRASFTPSGYIVLQAGDGTHSTIRVFSGKMTPTNSGDQCVR